MGSVWVWRQGEVSEGRFHVMPIGDLREHFPSVACWCKPRVEEGVIVHNSLDRREDYEPKGEA